MSLADTLYRQDHRVQAANDRYSGSTGSGLYVSPPGKTMSGIAWAFLAGLAVSAILILCGL